VLPGLVFHVHISNIVILPHLNKKVNKKNIFFKKATTQYLIQVVLVAPLKKTVDICGYPIFALLI